MIIEILTGLIGYAAIFVLTVIARNDYRKRPSYQDEWEVV